MRNPEEKILSLNIDRFKRMLEREEDENKRAALLDLLAEMQAKLHFVTDCDAIGETEAGEEQRLAQQRIIEAGEKCASMALSCQSTVSRSELLMLSHRYLELANTHCPRLRRELIARWERQR